MPDKTPLTESEINTTENPEVVETTNEVQAEPVVVVTDREYRHETCGTVSPLEAHSVADMRSNPERWKSLFCPCQMVGIAIGPNGEVVWNDTGKKVDPYDM